MSTIKLIVRYIIGKNAGKIIENRIKKSEKSIKILSPYVSPSLIDLLLEKKETVKDIKLISSAKIDDFRYPKNSILLRKLILQNRNTDEDAINKRKSLYNFTVYLTLILIIYTLISIVLLATKNINLFTLTPYVYMISVILILFLRKKILSIRTYTYSYTTPFFIKFINDDELFLHYKLYIIDNSYAFLGSLNFTRKGLFDNYESCITIKDEKVVKKLSDYFDYITNISCRQVDISLWGRIIHGEPIN
ncbi:phospholipase D family protein [Thermoanaerobacterium saccharolyticum]|uniref:phospholipase D family protein n=1 Tax=Thermoanaerobacterium saccharolyticum TaxID=28896 RepID=UPI002FD91AD8